MFSSLISECIAILNHSIIIYHLKLYNTNEHKLFKEIDYDLSIQRCIKIIIKNNINYNYVLPFQILNV